jgi:hypothetical protein
MVLLLLLPAVGRSGMRLVSNSSSMDCTRGTAVMVRIWQTRSFSSSSSSSWWSVAGIVGLAGRVRSSSSSGSSSGRTLKMRLLL